MSKSIQQNIVRLEITMHIFHFSEILERLHYFFEIEFSLVELKSELILKQRGQISARQIFHGDVQEVLILEGVSTMDYEVAINCVQYLLLYTQQVDLVLLDHLVHIHDLNRE